MAELREVKRHVSIRAKHDGSVSVLFCDEFARVSMTLGLPLYRPPCELNTCVQTPKLCENGHACSLF
jgi:hypothetical protein